MKQDDPHLVFRPVDSLTDPPDGLVQVIKDAWWCSLPDRGLLFYRSTPKSCYLAPQCNRNQDVAEAIRLRFYPWAELVFVPAVFIPTTGREWV
jgi:hypothetical protein